MRILVLTIVCITLSVACGSPATSNTNSNSNSTVAKTNVNAVNTAAAYSRSENAYMRAVNSVLARDLTPSGKAAREIVGMTVSESKLWENKAFDTPLREVMGAEYATMKKFWNTETPIKKFGDFLMMTGCEQHNCADNQYVIFIDLGVGDINVIHIGKEGNKTWNAYREINLPPPFAEELAAMKEHK